MQRRSAPDSLDPPRQAAFGTTHWSIVLAARDRSTPQAREALERLCAAYWYPLYAFVRRKGHDADQAMDLVQGFFARLLEKDDLADVHPSKGRFRSFLMAACSHYLANQHDRSHALKRGGRPLVSLDAIDAERRYVHEPSHNLTPDRLYLRRWATTLLDRVLDRLGAEWLEAGKWAVFEALKPALLGDSDAGTYGQLGAQVGLHEGAARVAAHRMRSRYREILREEVAHTVADPGEVDREIRDLFTTLSE
jgi:DNA-directed RNA polymerase specialized sigma24 family protein